MSQQSAQKGSVVVKLAALELLAARLEAQQNQADFRRNQLIADILTVSRAELKQTFNKIASEEYDDAIRTLKVTWLRLTLANRIMEADNTEAILGEGNFLELVSPETPWEPVIQQGLAQLEQQMRALKQEVLQKSKGPKNDV